MTFSTRFSPSIIPLEKAWKALALNKGPFVDFRFLAALERSGCVGEHTAWLPHHLVIEQDDEVVALMPGYIKRDSMGEYVFDHSWANAYYQYNLSYYPKWISAIPFTPVTAPKLLYSPNHTIEDIICAVNCAISGLQDKGISSAHWLFCQDERLHARPSQYLLRQNVQFQWHNYDYASFEQFTMALTSRKRKEISKTYRQFDAQGIRFTHTTGEQLSREDLAFFLRCYQRTYLKRSGHTGYLNEAFFKSIFESMGEHVLLVTAYQADTPIACALFFFDHTGLYGRYWGAVEPVDSLHFVCCYLEGIRFAIQKGLPLFNPGTQGEHKILRGFEPIYCYSLHRLFDQRFHRAVADFLDSESHYIINYFNQAVDVLPFNSLFSPQLKTMCSVPPSALFKNNDKENHL